MQGVVDSFGDTILTFTESGTHNCHTTIFQNSLHIGKVQVDCTTHRNNLGDTLGSNGKCVISFAESIHKSKVGIYFAQAFIVDNQ